METDSAMVQQPGSSGTSNPEVAQPTQPAQPSPAQTGGQVVEEKKASSWMKLTLIILGILIVLGGMGYWIFK